MNVAGGIAVDNDADEHGNFGVLKGVFSMSASYC